MNREIKFRAWDVNEKRMVYVSPSEKWAPTTGQLIENFEDEHLMQYTGLKDKNGREIWEGDILNCNRTGFVSGNFTNIPSVVSWEGVIHAQFIATPIRNEEQKADENYGVFSHYDFGVQIYPSDCEVIGNIHENPELLK